MSALHGGLLNEQVIVKLHVPLLQWHWWSISWERDTFSTFALMWAYYWPWWSMKMMVVGVGCYIGEQEDSWVKGESREHSILTGVHHTAFGGFYSSGDSPPWTLLSVSWCPSRISSQLQCNVKPAVEFVFLRWVKLYITMLSLCSF